MIPAERRVPAFMRRWVSRGPEREEPRGQATDRRTAPSATLTGFLPSTYEPIPSPLLAVRRLRPKGRRKGTLIDYEISVVGPRTRRGSPRRRVVTSGRGPDREGWRPRSSARCMGQAHVALRDRQGRPTELPTADSSAPARRRSDEITRVLKDRRKRQRHSRPRRPEEVRRTEPLPVAAPAVTMQ